MGKKDNAQISLQVVVDEQVVFESDGRWLYPLFDLENYLQNNPIPMGSALVRDKVIGKAAALLLIRIGTGQVHGELMSELAVQVLTHFNIPHTHDRLVSRIDCQTETLLLDVDDPDQAYRILCQRAGRC